MVAPVGYEIRIKGRLSDSLSGAFEDFTASGKPAETVMRGEDPLARFGLQAARHLRRTDGFPHCPDVIVNSTYWEPGEVGPSRSWSDRTAAWAAPRCIRPSCGWLATLGHTAYSSSDSPGESTRTSTSGARSPT